MSQISIFPPSLPPVGGATAANQVLEIAKLTSIDSKLTSPLTVTVSSSVLPTGAATSALQTSVMGTVAPGAAASNALLTAGIYNAAGVTLTTGQQSALQLDNDGSLRVAVVDNIADIIVTGAITSTQTVVASCDGKATSTFQVTGTWTGSIVTEGTVDGVNWLATNYVALTSGGVSSSFSTNTIGQVNTAGFNSFRLRGNTVTSGSASVTIIASVSASVIQLDHGLQAGTNNIGSINNVTGTVSLPTGASTSALQTTGNSSLSSIDGKTPALGQALAAASVPVVLTAAQLITLTPPSTVAVTGPLTDTQLRASAVPVSLASTTITGSVAVTAASLPLPTGASTSALQTTGNTSLSSIDTKTPALGQALAAASVPVVLTAAQLTTLTPLATVAVSSISSALPTGTNTIGYIKNAGLANANAPVYIAYSSTNVTTAAYVQLIASTTSEADNISIFDSSGQAMILAIGAPGSEVIQRYVQPGGETFNLAIPAGTRIAIKALTANATSGYTLLNLLG